MITLALFASAPFSGAQTRERSQIPAQDTWNLADICSTDAAWKESKDKLASRLGEFTRFQGKLSVPDEILACLDLNAELSKEFGRLSSYASMKSDQDTRDTKAMGMRAEMTQLGTDYNSKASFIEPELVRLDSLTIEKFIVQEPKLAVFRLYLLDIQRRKAHKLSEKEEKIVAEAGLMADAPYSINTIFSNADLPYPDVKLSDGETVKLNQAGYSRYRALPNRADRELVFHEFWSAIKKFERTMGAQLYANVKKDMFYARARNYSSSLASALDANAIPETVYRALIDNVNENLATFHRYLQLKKRMLGVDTLKYSDLYAPVVKGVELNYSIDEAKKLVKDAVKPLGASYLAVVDKAFANRWIDVYPSTGKLSGAYSNGSVYDVHPYILLNYNGQYDDVSTLAHELGHTMHSYLSNTTQPYPLADYPIFVAEVASTFNEALLIHKMLNEIKDDDTRLSLLMEYLDGIKGTVFRQTQFAEYELAIHEKAEKGEPLTGEAFTQLYGDILKKYYGSDQGVCQLDDLVTVEWAYIPHFYYNFYVYQYATSFTASTALAEKVINGEKGAADKYLHMLSSGGSKYPIDLLKDAGVDMTSKDPFQLTIKAMNRTMDEIEKILDKKTGKK
jgi:oligoendopeptidase F